MSDYRVRWELNNHIVGKVYALDQTNMNLMIKDLESLRKKLAVAKEALEIIAEDDCPDYITDPEEWKQWSDIELWEVCSYDRKICREALTKIRGEG